MDVGLTVGDSIDRLVATVEGFDFAEFAIGEGGADPDSVDRERLEGALGDAGADLCVHLPYRQVVATGVPELDTAIVEYQTRLLEWAGRVDAEKAVLHATMRNPHDVAARSMFADQVRAIADAGRASDVEVVLENVGHQARGVPLSVMGDVARETDTAVCFDVGHAYMEGGNDAVERFCRQDGDLVTHLHVHDARSRGDTHLPLGAGQIEYEPVAETFAQFEGTVAIEVFTDDPILLADSARRIRELLS